MPSQHSGAEKVLFLSLSGIGNYIMQSPTIASVKQAHPNWHITVWVAPRGTKELAKADPNVDEVIEMPIQTSVIRHIKQIQILRKKQFDVAIILSPGQLVKSAAYTFFVGIPTRIGAKYPLFRNTKRSLFLTDAVEEKEKLHDIEQNLRFIRPLEIDPTATQYQLHLTDKTQQAATKVIQGLAIPNDKQLIGIHPGSASDLPAKRWPITQFAAVAQELIAKHNAHILIFGGSEEENLKQELKHKIGGGGGSCITTSLLVTAAIIQHCKLFLSNDSGLMHIAAASNVITFGLFGPTNEQLTGPRGKNSHVIRALGTTPIYNTETKFDLGHTSHPTMTAITPDMVITQLESSL